MKRYNIFYEVHKGLRALLYETALKIQQTDFIINEETEQLPEHIKNVIQLFNKHAHSEDQFVFAAIHTYEPEVVDVFEKEHLKNHSLSEHLANLLSTFSNAIYDDEKLQIGQLLYQAFIEFMIFNLEQMTKEEEIINKLLWRNYSDEELFGIAVSILANTPLEQTTQFTKWMMRGLSNIEITNWLIDVKNTGPDFVFQSLLKTAEQQLIPQRLQLVQEALTEGAMIA